MPYRSTIVDRENSEMVMILVASRQEAGSRFRYQSDRSFLKNSGYNSGWRSGMQTTRGRRTWWGARLISGQNQRSILCLRILASIWALAVALTSQRERRGSRWPTDPAIFAAPRSARSEEHTSELQSPLNLV